MLQSHVIDIDRRFGGVALRLDRGCRFIATDPRVEDLSEIIWPQIDDVRRVALRALVREDAPASGGGLRRAGMLMRGAE
ncbi:MAG TPA: hypothetical protein VHY82_01695 [Acetobacteraceae bacterium]|nr:hypothetical protein [Acetobacteraceae bacterium]